MKRNRGILADKGSKTYEAPLKIPVVGTLLMYCKVSVYALAVLQCSLSNTVLMIHVLKCNNTITVKINMVALWLWHRWEWANNILYIMWTKLFDLLIKVPLPFSR